eukprot:9327658-Pyramimonas_sp.AAC.1
MDCGSHLSQTARCNIQTGSRVARRMGSSSRTGDSMRLSVRLLPSTRASVERKATERADCRSASLSPVQFTLCA